MKSNVAPDTTEATFSSAREYADLGFAPIRLYGIKPDGSCQCGGGEECAVKRRIGKHPVGAGWQDAPINAAAVDKHIARGGNVGLRMGDQPSGARYIALDEDEAGALAKGEALWGSLPVTMTSRTGSGGRHCIYEWPADRPYPTNKVRSNGLVFDVRGQGSQIVVEPSRNANGAYTWIEISEPQLLPEAWVAALLADSGKRTGPKKAGMLPHIETADPDERTAATVAALLPFWEAPDPKVGRRNRLRAFGSMLAEYGWTDEQIAAFATALPMARSAAERVAATLEGATARRADVPKTIGYGELECWNPDALQAFEAVARDPRMPEFFEGIWSEFRAKLFEWAARDQAKADQAKAELKGAANDTDPQRSAGVPAADTAGFEGHYILQSSTHSDNILLWRGADRGHQPVALGSLRLVVKDAGLEGKIPLFDDVETKSGESKRVKVPAPTLVERHGMHFDHTAYDFARRVSEYVAERSLVIVGYPDVRTSGTFDAAVDAWLRVLAGDAYPQLEAWIASCAQQNIHRLAAALVLIGPADLGKSLFSCAVSGLWGAETPPAAALLIKQFNGELKKCAVVCDEEAQLFGSKALSTKRFRELTQSVERSIELKGLETFTLRGALRIIVPCNEISDLRFTDLGGPDIVKAVIDRLCVIDCKPRAAACKAALERLRLPGGWVCDRDRVTSHMAWLCQTVELPAERFIGAVAGVESVLAGHVEEHVDLWEGFRNWLESECFGAATAWRVHGGRLCANPATLATALEKVGKGWDQKRVQDGLAPFTVGQYRPDANGTAGPRLRELNPTAIATALRLGAEDALTLTKRIDDSKLKPLARDGTNKFKRR